MSGSVSCGRFCVGLTYSRPLLRPRWCTRTIGAPSKIPPTLPSLARNSAMVFAFQSSVSLMSNSCRSRSRGMRWDRVMEGPAAVPGDQVFDLVLPGSGAGFEPAACRLVGERAFCLSLGGDAFCAGEMRRQELSGSVQRRGRFVEDRVIGLEDVGHTGGDLEGALDVRGGSLPGEADGVVEENLVRSGLDDQGRQAGQLGEYGADETESGILPRRIVGDSGVECLWAEQRIGLALGFHGRPRQGEVGIR